MYYALRFSHPAASALPSLAVLGGLLQIMPATYLEVTALTAE